MSFYCGIDLSARESQICVIDKGVKKVLEVKVPNKLEHIKQLLAPYQADLQIVVESTFNWYWLVDGLQAAGYNVVLAHPGVAYDHCGESKDGPARRLRAGEVITGRDDSHGLHLPDGDAPGA